MQYDLAVPKDDYEDENQDLSDGIEVYLDEIHGEVSRTFDAALQKLSGDLKRHVQIGYLMCRIPDTIEDSGHLSGQQKHDLLNKYREVLEAPDQKTVKEFVGEVFEQLEENVERPEVGEYGALTDRDNRHRIGEIGGHSYASDEELSYWDLVKNTQLVTHAFQTFEPEVKEQITEAVDEMSQGMANYAKRAYENGNKGITIKDMDDLEDYCHYVAGTVGELLTDIFSHHRDMPNELEEHSEDFGQFLQTVNIIKDPVEDLEEESAKFIPEEAMPGSKGHEDLEQALVQGNAHQLERPIDTLVDRAEKKGKSARNYIEMIDDSEISGYLEVPFLLAKATLRESKGEHQKIIDGDLSVEREEVFEIMTQAGETDLEKTVDTIESQPLQEAS